MGNYRVMFVWILIQMEWTDDLKIPVDYCRLRHRAARDGYLFKADRTRSKWIADALLKEIVLFDATHGTRHHDRSAHERAMQKVQFIVRRSCREK